MKNVMSLAASLAIVAQAWVASAASADTLKDRIASAIAARVPAPGRYKITFAEQEDGMQQQGEAHASWKIAELSFNPGNQTFRATLTTRNQLGNQEQATVTGSALPVMDVPALAHDIVAGETVSSSSLTTTEVPAARMSASMITSAETLVGQVARRNMRASTPLFAFDFAKPILVKKGDLVTMSIDIPGIQLSAQGQAMANAGKGDVISIMNTTSRRMVEARVTGSGTAVISPASQTLATR